MTLTNCTYNNLLNDLNTTAQNMETLAPGNGCGPNGTELCAFCREQLAYAEMLARVVRLESTPAAFDEDSLGEAVERALEGDDFSTTLDNACERAVESAMEDRSFDRKLETAFEQFVEDSDLQTERDVEDAINDALRGYAQESDVEHSVSDIERQVTVIDSRVDQLETVQESLHLTVMLLTSMTFWGRCLWLLTGRVPQPGEFGSRR